MREIRAALQDFWQGFTDRSGETALPVPAFVEGSTDRPETPYIVYELGRARFGESLLLGARIWTRNGSSGLLDDLLTQLETRLPEGGTRLVTESGGVLLLRRGKPFIQLLGTEEPAYAAATVSAAVTFYV